MAMSHDEFVALIKRLEVDARLNPQDYNIRLGLLAALGYVYIFGILLGVIGCFVLLVLFSVKTGRFYSGELKLFFILIILAGVIVKSLWVTIPAPEGIEIRPAEAPELFALIEEVRTRLRVARFHRVLLTDDYNAAIAQIPSFGILGGYRSYLILGVPLMQSLSPEQFRAVLAHEMGHVSENHGRFGVWIGRVRETWGRLMGQFEGSGHHGAMLFNGFAKWYGPQFMARSFVLARAHEVSADQYAEQLAGKQTAASTLAAINMYALYLDKRFWPGVFKQIDQSTQAPAHIYTGMVQELRQPLDETQADAWLLEALGPRTDYDDTHPALRDRLAALGLTQLPEQPAVRKNLLPVPGMVTAAECFLGNRLPLVTAQLDAEWAQAVAPKWQAMHEARQEGWKKLETLEATAAQRPLAKGESWERAKLTGQLKESEDALPLLHEMLATWPDFLPAKFAVGTILLGQNDESGIPMINEAMRGDEDFVLPGCEAIVTYFKRHGRDEEARPYLQCGMARYEVLETAEQEAGTLTIADTFVEHDLSAETVTALRQQLAGIPQVKIAYLVRKVIRTQANRHCYVLGIAPKFAGLVLDETKAVENLLNQVIETATLPEGTLVVILHGNNRSYETKFRKLPGAAIYQQE